ncbi:MAG: hypothetical protein ACKOPT_00360 [Cyanobium sp.]
MRHLLLPLGLSLAGALLSPLSASAVPIQAANGVAVSVPGRASGPRHPGVITLPKSSEASPSFLKSSGRPVPGQGQRIIADAQPL